MASFSNLFDVISVGIYDKNMILCISVKKISYLIYEPPRLRLNNTS